MDQTKLTDLEATKQLFDRLKVPYAENTEDLGSEENPWFQIIGADGTKIPVYGEHKCLELYPWDHEGPMSWYHCNFYFRPDGSFVLIDYGE